MIDKKKIEEAAQGYCDATYGTLNTSPLIVEGFKQGADWTIKEYPKSLWHDAGEEPYPPARIAWIIMQTGKDSWEIVKHDGYRDGGQTWQNEAKKGHISRWCYLEDLLTPEDASRTRLRAMLYCIADRANEKTMNQADCNRLSAIMPQEGSKP